MSNLPMENMVNKPWECPRCKRINAPSSTYCDCKPIVHNSVTNNTNSVFDNIFPSAAMGQTNIICQNCGGYHDVLNGIPAQCISLQTKTDSYL